MADDEQQALDGEQRPDGGADVPASGIGPAPDAEAVPETEAAPAEGPAYGNVRYSRRRLLILGGGLVAGAAAAIAGVRAFGGSAVSDVGGAITDEFGPFPVRSADPVPDVPADKWVVKVDGLVDRPLTLDRAAWTGLQRKNETVDFNCVEGWTVDNVRWGGAAPSVLLAFMKGVKCAEIPIDYRARAGETKLNTITDGLGNIAQLFRKRMSLGVRPSRVAKSCAAASRDTAGADGLAPVASFDSAASGTWDDGGTTSRRTPTSPMCKPGGACPSRSSSGLCRVAPATLRSHLCWCGGPRGGAG